MSHDAVTSLREALKVSPNNLPLREHLARTLLGVGRYEEAEQEFRQALGLSPNHHELRAGLARAFAQQGKTSQAVVVLEALVQTDGCPPAARLLYSRLLLKSGDEQAAEDQYRQAVRADAALADPELAWQLGIGRLAAEDEEDRKPVAEFGDSDES